MLMSGAALLAQTAEPAKPAAARAKPEREPGSVRDNRDPARDDRGKLFEKESPITVKNFVALAKRDQGVDRSQDGQMREAAPL